MPLRQLIEMLAPPECLGCGSQGVLLCVDCRNGVRRPVEICCFCHRSSRLGLTCGGCFEQKVLAGVSVAARYEGAVKKLILSLKFERTRSGAGVAAQLLLSGLEGGLVFDVVTAVPIAPGRYRERGYNQSELIGRVLARHLRLPYRSLLGRTTTEHQMGRSRIERLVGVQGAFYAVGKGRGERVLIVDDVVTTGATLDECAWVLREAGASEVWGAAVARH